MSNEVHARVERSEQLPEASVVSGERACAPCGSGPVFAEVLLDQLPDAGICQLGLYGEVQYWHPSAGALLGYDAPQMFDRPLAALYPEEERAQARNQRALFAASAHGRDQHHVALLARDGNRHPCLLNIRCIYDQNDDPRAFAVLLLSARDNASGIETDQIDHVFAPFHRGQKTQADPGSGIGLALCQRICWRHRGDIRIAETGPEGTVFIIQLGESHDRRHDDHI